MDTDTPSRRPETLMPTQLGQQVARPAGLLSLNLLCRHIDTHGQIAALKDAIALGDDTLTRTLALNISRLDPGHPQARQLQTILDPLSRVLN